MSLGQGLRFFYSKLLLDPGHGLWTQRPAQLPVPCRREWLQIFLDQNFEFLYEIFSKFKYWSQIQTHLGLTICTLYLSGTQIHISALP